MSGVIKPRTRVNMGSSLCLLTLYNDLLGFCTINIDIVVALASRLLTTSQLPLPASIGVTSGGSA